MRISVIRTLAACVLLGFVSGVASHAVIQDPPSRSWFCGAITKPDQVANDTAKFPVCGNAFSAPVRHNDQFTLAPGQTLIPP
jgi:predicted carbohydrate-binding protein with CBM5 and CBM33 domain